LLDAPFYHRVIAKESNGRILVGGKLRQRDDVFYSGAFRGIGGFLKERLKREIAELLKREGVRQRNESAIKEPPRQAKTGYKSLAGMTWHSIVEVVVVGFIFYKDMLSNREARRRIKRTGGDAYDPAIGLAPKQDAAAHAAETAFSRGRGSIPDQRRGLGEMQMGGVRRAKRRVMPAGSAALGTMACRNGA